MRVTVTGGAGFIGSHVVERLEALGHDVTVLDDFSTGTRANLTMTRARIVEGSICDQAAVERAVDGAALVVHLAAVVGVSLAMTNTVQTIETNVIGTSVVLRAAARHRAKALVASSSEVYGRSTAAPFREDDAPALGPTQSPRWAYGCSKALDEWLTFGLMREQGLEPIVCRFFNVAGPRQVGTYGMVLPRFVRQALSGQPLTVYGDGTQTRCFAHVLDVADAVVALALEARAVGQVINVGSIEEVRVVDLASAVLSATASRSPITFVPYERAYGAAFEDTHRRVPDVGRLRALLGRALERTTDSIIADTVAWARSAG